MGTIHTRTIFTLFFTIGLFISVEAQDASSRGGGRKEELPKGIQENLAKQRIEREKEDYVQLLQRGEEAVKLSSEVEKSFSQNNQLSAADRKKLDRLEKVVKKIRSEIGANDDDSAIETESKPLTILNALDALQNNTAKLVEELKKSTRYSISVIAIESSNLLLKVVRFLRFDKK